MQNLNCDYVREVYPDVLHDVASASTVAAVRAHLAGCEECREEAALIERLHGAPLTVPAGLEARVRVRLAAQPRARRFGPKHLALVASLAAALAGGPLLVNSLREPAPTITAEAPAEGGLGVIGVEAAMLTGTGSLQDLTVEELEQLLGEIET